MIASKRLALAAGVALIAAPLLGMAAAHAHLSINKLWVEFSDGSVGRSDVVIRNDSQDRYYVSVSVTEVMEPGTENEHRVSLTDPEAAGLLVTPNRMILEPGALRSIRLVSLNENLTKDRIYRVLISPQVGEVKSEGREESVTGIAIKMLAAYEVLVVARPRAARPDVQVQRVGNEATIANVGGTNILMTEASVCPPDAHADSESCTRFPATRLYAGNNLLLPLGSVEDRVRITTRSGPGAEPVTVEY